MTDKDFVHLHTHTMYSLLDGVGSPEELVSKANLLGQKALAITDHGSMAGVVDFYDKCQKIGVKPILGCEIYVTPDRFVKDKSKKANANHLILLAKNETGYKNLLIISSKAELEGFYYKPRADLRLVSEYKDGLIVLSGCLKSELAEAVLNDDKGESILITERYRDLFGSDYYLEIQPNGLPEQVLYNKRVANLARLFDIPIVATNDVHYMDENDYLVQDALLAIQSKKKLSDNNRMKFDWDKFHLASYEQMANMFAQYHPSIDKRIWVEAMGNTGDIAKSIDVNIESTRGGLPEIKLPEGYSEEHYLIELCKNGWDKRNGGSGITREYYNRLAYEIEEICQQGFAGYFFIIYDLIDFANSKGIAYGPGRGSVASSLVAYLLGITDVDPIKYGLLFDRFISPSRREPPDIDLDFQEDRRNEIKEYLSNKYGESNVASIRVNSNFRAKNAFKDTCRIMDIPIGIANKYAKNIYEIDGGNSLSDFYSKAGPDIGVDKYPLLEEISTKLEGKIRQRGQHAAGVIISDKSLLGSVPLEIVNKQVTCAFDKYAVSRMGYLKLDILGSNTIKILEQTRKLIKTRSDVDIEWGKIDMNDPKALKEFSKGNNVGIFQFWKPGISQLCVDIKPKSFGDIIAINALYRPGPLRSGITQEYVQRKAGFHNVPDVHKELKKITRDTYGLIIYQEQAMQLFHDIAGFDKVEADEVRHTMSKVKGVSAMQKYQTRFMKGATKTVGAKEAGQLWKALQQFGAYLFNKAHSTAYSFISYYLMWLKVHYPLEFICINLANAPDEERMRSYIGEARRLGIKVLRPDINKSNRYFEIESGMIRAGLDVVKGVGDKAIDTILKKRGKGYGNFKDFLDSVHGNTVRKDVILALIKSGAFVNLYPNVTQMEEDLEDVIKYLKSSKKSKKAIDSTQITFGFDGFEEKNDKYFQEIEKRWKTPEKVANKNLGEEE